MMVTDISEQMLNKSEDWKVPTTLYSRCIIKSSDFELANFLSQKGYCFIDRTLKATISLRQVEKFRKFCRMPLEFIERPNGSIYDISVESFINDWRFIVDLPPKLESSIPLIKRYVKSINTRGGVLMRTLLLFVDMKKKLRVLLKF